MTGKSSEATRSRTRPSADATRDRILEGALGLFADKSFDGASTREIAARAGVTQPLLNYHFRSKTDLWEAAVDQLFDELRSALGDRLHGLRGVDQLTVAKLLVREFIYFSAARPQLNRVLNQECKSDGPRMDWLVEKHIGPIYEQTTQMFAGLVESGDLPDVPLHHLYYLVTGASSTMFVLAPECRRLAGVDPQSEEVVEAHASAVITMLFGTR